MRLLLVLALLLPGAAWAQHGHAAPAAPSADGKIKVRLLWENKDFAGTMKVYTPSELGKKKPLWETKAVKDFAQVPVESELVGGALEMAPGTLKKLVLVVKNESKDSYYFFAAPHMVDPVEHSLGFKFHCLCINHAFEVPPGQTWYRVVELKINDKFEGGALDIKHFLLGISKERMKDFALPAKGTAPEPG